MQLARFAEIEGWLVSPDRGLDSSKGLLERHFSSCVVLLHGYGAPGTDLVPLARALRAPPDTLFVFPQAPHAMLGGPAKGNEGRAWWPIDIARLQVATLTGRLERLADEYPPGLDAARRDLEAFLGALAEAIELPQRRLVLGGFSQGAMLACDTTLRKKARPADLPLAGLVLLSGTTLCQDEWFPLMRHCQGLPVFQSHAPDDPVLPYSLAERLHGAFTAAGAAAKFVPFTGGHGISQPVLDKLSHFLCEVLS